MTRLLHSVLSGNKKICSTNGLSFTDQSKLLKPSQSIFSKFRIQTCLIAPIKSILSIPRLESEHSMLVRRWNASISLDQNKLSESFFWKALDWEYQNKKTFTKETGSCFTDFEEEASLSLRHFAWNHLSNSLAQDSNQGNIHYAFLTKHFRCLNHRPQKA